MAEGGVCFSRNALVDASFDELRRGQPVELAVQRKESEKGLQASTVRLITALKCFPGK
jgi:cold shock CspA family protein